MAGTDLFEGMCSQQAIRNVHNPNLIDDARNQSEMVDVLNINFCGLAHWLKRKTSNLRRSYLWVNLRGYGEIVKTFAVTGLENYWFSVLTCGMWV